MLRRSVTKVGYLVGGSRRQLTVSAPRSTINKVGVVGGGQMGFGITLTAALRGGKQVTVVDVSQSALDKSLAFSTKWLQGQVAKGQLSAEEKDKTLALIRTSTKMSDLADSDFVVEAVSENEEVKKVVFETLATVTADDVILASNTSSIPITRIGSFTGLRCDKVIGMHFMNPVPIMKLVEVIPALTTDEKVTETVLALAKSLGKKCTVSRDEPGFVVNRILMPYLNEAVLCLQEGVATKEDIDTAMKLGTNVPMGPLRLADFIGIDTCLSILQTMHQGFGDSKYRGATLWYRYVEAGRLGKKTGKGFYDYVQK